MKECCSGKLRNLQCRAGVEVTCGGVQPPWPEVVQFDGSIPHLCGMMNICGHAPGVVICYLHFVALCLASAASTC